MRRRCVGTRNHSVGRLRSGLPRGTRSTGGLCRRPPINHPVSRYGSRDETLGCDPGGWAALGLLRDEVVFGELR